MSRSIQSGFALLLLAVSAVAGYQLRHWTELANLVVLLGWGGFAAFLFNAVVGPVSRWSDYAWGVSKFCMLVIVCVAVYTITTFHFWSIEERLVQNYVQDISPQLEDYRNQSGHYPSTLADITNLPRIPEGLKYSPEENVNPHTFRFDYYGLEYWSGSGEWFNDD